MFFKSCAQDLDVVYLKLHWDITDSEFCKSRNVGGSCACSLESRRLDNVQKKHQCLKKRKETVI